MFDTTFTAIGNLAADPELRFTPSGRAVCNLTVYVTPRRFNKDKGEWLDLDPLVVRVTVWGVPAENAAESYAKGSRVIAHGVLRARSFESKAGEKHTVWELEQAELAASTTYAPVSIRRPVRSGAPAPIDPFTDEQATETSRPASADA
jgi:single-strand DNA-binding protein